MATPVSFRWAAEFVALIDQARGDVPRSAWVRRVIERELAHRELVASTTPERAYSHPEQVRTKRDRRPLPKAKPVSPGMARQAALNKAKGL